MVQQLVRRLVLLALTLLGASLLVFLVVNVFPGDPAQVILGTSATPETVRVLHEQLGLDQPGWQRYLAWIAGMLHGDFGQSVLSKSAIAPEIGQRLLVSGPLALLGTLVSLAIALPLGALA